MSETLTSTIESPIGPLTLDRARRRVDQPVDARAASLVPTTRVTPSIDDAWFKDVAAQLDAYFAGELTDLRRRDGPARHGVPTTRVGPAVRDPLRRDDLLR